jgi:RND superfamily putative drug exporter
VRWFLNRPGDHVAGVTGPVPAEYEQSQIIGKDIVWVELFTVLAIALIVGVRFRSVGAPLATLACAATAYVIAIRVVVCSPGGWASRCLPTWTRCWWCCCSG